MSLIRNSNDIKIKASKLKTPKIIGKLFKTGGVLAHKNLKRSKKKYRTTVISITISIFIFITMSAFVNNMFDFTSSYYKYPDYNIRVSSIQNEKDQILALEGIEKYYLLYMTKYHNYLKIYDLDRIMLKDYLNLEDEEDGNADVIDYMGLDIVGLSDDTFKAYAKKLNLSYDKVKDKGILVDSIAEYVDGETVNKRMYNYEVGDKILGKYANNEDTPKDYSVTVGAVTDTKPFGIENYFYYGGYLIVDMEYFKDIDFELKFISIQAKDADKIEEAISKMNSSIGVNNIEAQVKEERAMSIIIKIFLYGFLGVITLIGVTNIFNTITSNMELRQKEFAALKSIGMTKKEFNRMVNLETIFYGTKSLCYGIILGLLRNLCII